MTLTRLFRIVVCGLAVCFCTGRTIVAAEPDVSSDDVRVLVERLKAAESRLDNLQSELQEVRTSGFRTIEVHSDSTPVMYAPATDEPEWSDEPWGAGENQTAATLWYDDPLQLKDVDRGKFEKRIEALEKKVADPQDDKDDSEKDFDGETDADDEGKKDNDKKKDKLEDFDERIKELEDRWKNLTETDEELTDAIAYAVTPNGSKSTMKIAGRIHADYWAFPGDSKGVNVFERGDSTLTPEDRLVFRRIRFGVRGDVNPNMDYRIEMEFAGGNDVEYRDVFMSFKHLPVLQTLRIGNQKRPYGLDHLNSSRYNVFMERPFSIEAINQDARRLGVVSYGVSDDLKYNWRYGVYNLRLIQDEAGYINDHYQLEAAGRFANTIWYDECSDGRGYAHWAVSGTRAYPNGLAPNNGVQDNEARFRHRPEARSTNRWIDTGRIAGADTYNLIGFEGVVNVGPLQVVAEQQHLWLDRDEGFGNGQDLQFSGSYIYASYFLTGEHMPWNRKSGTLGRIKPFENFFLVDRCGRGCGGGWGAWQVAARYSYADFTDQDVLGGVGEAFTLGLNWYWNPQARMQFNYINGRISERRVADAATGQIFTSGTYEIIGTRMMIDF